VKGGGLLQSIVEDHALIDGNKRLGWLATGTFLELNGVGVTQVSNEAVYDFVMRVAAGHHEIADLAAELRALIPH
jgi:death-on-curing protein